MAQFLDEKICEISIVSFACKRQLEAAQRPCEMLNKSAPELSQSVNLSEAAAFDNHSRRAASMRFCLLDSQKARRLEFRKDMRYTFRKFRVRLESINGNQEPTRAFGKSDDFAFRLCGMRGIRSENTGSNKFS
jgi:hypothetical protein